MQRRDADVVFQRRVINDAIGNMFFNPRDRVFLVFPRRIRLINLRGEIARFELRQLAHSLLRDSDATSMAHSLELRVPFNDIAIAKFARRCAPDLRARLVNGRLEAKRVLAHALRGVVPSETLQRPKAGFSLPFESWLDGALKPMSDAALQPSALQKRGLIDTKILEAEQRAGRVTLHPCRWSLLILELWAQAVLDGARRFHGPVLLA